MSKELQSRSGRLGLEPKGKPYKASLDRGVTIGYRRNKEGPGVWVAIISDGNGGQWTASVGYADDIETADDTNVLNYAQARQRVEKLANEKRTTKKIASRPVTIREALVNYEKELRGGRGNPHNATTARFHLGKDKSLLDESLHTVGSKRLNDWRRDFLGGRNLSTQNRVLKSVRACFNLAAEHDDRIADNAKAWKGGLPIIAGADKARNAVIELPQVRALVAEAYARRPDTGFGEYVQAHAELGSRSDQIARIRVGDLGKDCVMVPNSAKGRGKTKSNSGYTRRNLSPTLAARFAALAKGRPADALLLTQPDGRGWTDGEKGKDWFPKIVEAVGIPLIDGKPVTLIAFRHSNIVRLLRENVPIKAVAQMHNTGVQQIEKHYAKFLPHDDLDRATVIDTGPRDNVVALAA